MNWRLKRLKKLNSRGDTIVEVLIVLAVLSLALSIGYATANRGLRQSRNAQEHSQALGIIDSQVELLRSAFAKQSGAAIEAQAASGPFCLSPSGTVVSTTPLANTGPNKFNENVSADKLNNTSTYPGPCIQNTLYNISIVGRGGGVYDFRVRWEGLGDLGRQQEELTYKIGNVTISPTGGYTNPAVPALCPAGYTGTPPACIPPPTCPAGYTGTPPACVPIPTGYTWLANGNNYSTCTNDASDPRINDNHDGCNPSADSNPGGGAVFARRGVDILYRFASSGTLTGSITSGAAQLTINFNQYKLAGSKPPKNYTFTIKVKIDGTLIQTLNLRPNGMERPTKVEDTVWDPKSVTTTVNIPVDNPNNIELDWTNNIGTDPDLQINSIRLVKP